MLFQEIKISAISRIINTHVIFSYYVPKYSIKMLNVQLKIFTQEKWTIVIAIVTYNKESVAK